MTFKVDNDALKVAMMRHYEEKLAKELREMFIYSGNEDTNRIWQLYMEELQRQEKRQELHTDSGHKIFIMLCLCMMAYGLYRIFTLSPT